MYPVYWSLAVLSRLILPNCSTTLPVCFDISGRTRDVLGLGFCVWYGTKCQ